MLIGFKEILRYAYVYFQGNNKEPLNALKE